MRRTLLIVLILQSALFAAILDRVAIVVDSNDIIKDSDIDRDLHATEFLNGEPPSVTPAERKKTASHLIDQVFIRQEIRIGDYPIATTQEANKQLEELVNQRFHNEAALTAALSKYDLTLPDLREQFRWQLTVLDFIDARFKPAVLISEESLDEYYKAHSGQLRKSDPKATEAQLRQAARETLTEEQVNKLFFAWLDQHRHDAKIRFLEEKLS
jgi:hypothetical protein